MTDMVMSIISGALAGLIYGGMGYFRNRNTADMFDGFKWKSFGSTVVGSAVFGAFAAYSGLAYDEIAASAMGLAFTQFLKSLISYLEVKLLK